MKFHVFNNNDTEQLFRDNKLSEFEQLWNLKSDWFEEPNHRRNGWSGVIKYALKTPSGGLNQVFIKRQENHNHKTLLHPIKGIPTFRREFFNITKLNRKNIPTLTALYYGERNIDGNVQSIIITQSLEAYQSFDNFFQVNKHQSEEVTSKIMKLAGQQTRMLHEAHWRHGSLYPKHFFVKAEKDVIDVRFIDLEKLKWFPLKQQVRFNDLSRIIRHHKPIPKQGIRQLIDAYLSYGKDIHMTGLAQKLDSLLRKQKD